MNEQESVSMPCPYIIFDPIGYHTCSLLPADKGRFCLCAWFYDLGNPCITIEVSIDPITKKFGAVSTFDLPQSEEYKDMVKQTKTEEDVPKLCPRGFTFKQIDAKIQVLNKRLIK